MNPTPPETLADRARALVDELATLMNEFPTEDPDVTPVALVRITVAGEDLGTAPLLPDQVEWMRTLVAAEAETCRNTDGQCGHCHGTGIVGG